MKYLDKNNNKNSFRTNLFCMNIKDTYFSAHENKLGRIFWWLCFYLESRQSFVHTYAQKLIPTKISHTRKTYTQNKNFVGVKGTTTVLDSNFVLLRPTHLPTWICFYLVNFHHSPFFLKCITGQYVEDADNNTKVQPADRMNVFGHFVTQFYKLGKPLL